MRRYVQRFGSNDEEKEKQISYSKIELEKKRKKRFLVARWTFMGIDCEERKKSGKKRSLLSEMEGIWKVV